MRLVLDTNVLISGIFWKGPPYQILRLWAERKITIVASQTILNEYIAVLRRLDPHDALMKKWEQFFINHIVITEDRNILSLSRDPNDDVFINCAFIARAQYIVSGDKDLLSLASISPTPVITPATLLRILKK